MKEVELLCNLYVTALSTELDFHTPIHGQLC